MVLWSARVHLDGSFPGFATHGGVLSSARAVLTREMLIVNDGRPDGFILPLPVISRVLQTDAASPAGALIIQYRAENEEYGFAIRPMLGWTRRPGSLSPVVSALESAGLNPVPGVAMDSLLVSPTLAPDRFQETIIWHGPAAAAPVPWGPPEPCHLWLSTRALFWTSDHAKNTSTGVLPLAALLDQTPGTARAASTAATLHLGYATNDGSRREMLLRFDHQSAANNSADCRALATGLRSRGVVFRPAAVAVQPWARRSEPLAEQEPVELRRPLLSLVPKPDLPGEHTWQSCEVGLLAGLTGLTDRLRHPDAASPPPDPGVALGAALAALEAAERTGVIPAPDAALRRSRLLALAAAVSRLRGLVQLAEAGHLTGVDLEARRTRILEPLEELLNQDRSENQSTEASA